MIELALPAGSLQAALHAFDGGADAVYLGLQEYSARKYATNFSFGELARLKQEAMRLGKAVYVTLNTLLDDQELEGILPTLRRLELVRPDGIIVQDLGLASLLCKEFPSLPVHASTQIAVHTAEGVREMQRLGFSRIVLSRELTFAQIAAIRQACPDADLKVFIHGAMCYGFSGLCMASHYLTGRSANRGECAQICRTWFTTEGTEESRSGYFFSMTDLAAAEESSGSGDIGINALKIEGRMKSPATCDRSAVHRMILDGETEPTALRNARGRWIQIARSSSGVGHSLRNETPAGMRHTPSLGTVDFPGQRERTSECYRASVILPIRLN
jgi:putative protease